MRRSVYACLLLAGLLAFTASCNDYETYGDMKNKERAAISRFLSDSAITVISQSAFEAQGETTDVSKNEYVYLDKSGVYMQIVRKGCGSMLEDGKNVNVLCRFSEYNILEDSMLIRNDVRMSVYNSSTGSYIDVSQYVDKMNVLRSGSTFTASFVSGMMYIYHGSASVPAGWLVPLLYVNVGRPLTETDEVAKVKLIVPHSQGTADASSSVYPCFYEITYEREK